MNKEFDIELLKREYKIRFSENWIAKKIGIQIERRFRILNVKS